MIKMKKSMQSHTMELPRRIVVGEKNIGDIGKFLKSLKITKEVSMIILIKILVILMIMMTKITEKPTNIVNFR